MSDDHLTATEVRQRVLELCDADKPGEALVEADNALRILPDLSSPSAVVRSARSAALFLLGRYDEAITDALGAVRVLEARATGQDDQWIMIEALLTACTALALAARPTDALREAQKAIELLGQLDTGDGETEATARQIVVSSLMQLGQLPEALTEATELVGLIDSRRLTGRVADEVRALHDMVRVAVDGGPQQAEGLRTRALLDVGRSEFLPLLRRVVGQLWAQGRTHEACAQQGALVAALLADRGGLPADDQDQRTELLRYVEMLKVVDDLDDACSQLQAARASIRAALAAPAAEADALVEHTLTLARLQVDLGQGEAEALEDLGLLIDYLAARAPRTGTDLDALLARAFVARANRWAHQNESTRAISDFDSAYELQQRCSERPDLSILAWRKVRAVMIASACRWREASEELRRIIPALSTHPDCGPMADETIDARKYLVKVLSRVDVTAWYEEFSALIETLDAHPRYGPDHSGTKELRCLRTRGLLSLQSRERADEPTDQEAVQLDRGSHDGSRRLIELLGDRGAELIGIHQPQDGITNLEAAYEASRAAGNMQHASRRFASVLSSGYVDVGRYQDAIDLQTQLVEGTAGAERGSREEWQHWHARAELAHALAAIGRLQDALDEWRSVLEQYRSCPRLDINGQQTLSVWSNYAAGLHHLGYFEEAISEMRLVIAAREKHPDMGRHHPRTLVDKGNLAINLAQLGRFEEALALHDDVVAAYSESSRFLYSSADALLARQKRASVYFRMGRIAEADAEFDAIVAGLVADKGDVHPLTASARLLAARTRETLGDVQTAYELRLAALAAMEKTRYTLSDAADRERWRADHAATLSWLLGLAAERRDGRLVAELIEAARTQGVPTRSGEEVVPLPDAMQEGRRSIVSRRNRPVRATDVVDNIGETTLGLDPLAPPPTIRVLGQSTLARALPTQSDDSDLAIELEAVLDRIAGSSHADVAWWGQWVTGPRIYQSLLFREDGSWRCEFVPPKPWLSGGGAESLATMTTTQPVRYYYPGTSLPIQRFRHGQTRLAHPVDPLVLRWRRAMDSWVLDSALGERPKALATPSAEAEALNGISVELLPPSLRRKLLASSRDRPMTLIIAPAPELADLPLALLPISEGRDSEAARVLDRAVVLYCPSVAFSYAVQDRKGATATAPTGVYASVIDPGSDLEFARPLSGATMVLQGEAATREAVSAVLSSASGNLVHFAAHATTAEARPADAAIELAGGELLRARDIVGSLVSASAVLLACCASASPPRSAEWLGLAPAFLWAGAEAVLATLWPLADTPAACEIEHMLAEMVCAGHESVGGALRRVQLTLLDDWRSGKGNAIHPHHFAGYIALTR